MKLTKFPQSCVLIETNDIKILIDPGNTKYDESFLNYWQKADIILLTHRHGDHVNAKAIEQLNKPIYSTKEVQDFYPSLKVNIIKENDILTFNKTIINVVKAVHGYVFPAGEIKENVGFIINDNNKTLYITSDTIRFKNNYKANVMFADITAFDSSMNLWGAGVTYNELGAKLMIVAHQDDGKVMYTKEQIKNYLTQNDINFIIPDILEQFEI